jgi:hypothetical protein
MEKEKIFYQQKILNFIREMEGQPIERIYFDLDTNPTFDISKVPFQFKYAYSVIIQSGNNKYLLNTASTLRRFETILIEKILEKNGIEKSFIIENVNQLIISA